MFEFFEPLYRGIQKLSVDHILPDQEMHHSQGQGSIAGRLHEKSMIRHGRSRGFIGFNEPDCRPFLLCLSQPVKKVNIGGHGIDSPQYDQVTLGDFIRVGGGCTSHHRFPTGFLGRRADRPIQAGGAEAVKEKMA